MREKVTFLNIISTLLYSQRAKLMKGSGGPEVENTPKSI